MKQLPEIIIILLVVLLFQLISLPLYAQFKVGNYPSKQHKAAVLELESSNQGLLLTRVADTSLINLLNPPDGMIIYFTDGKTEFPFGSNAGILERKNNIWRRPGITIDSVVDASRQGIRFLYSNGTYTLRIPNAELGLRGLVSTGAQQFGGRKTFVDSIVLQNVHPGSVIFVRDAPSSVNYALTDNNTQFFWDNFNERLGIGTNTPSATLDIEGNFKLGKEGSVLHSIIRDSVMTLDPSPLLNSGDGHLYSFPMLTVREGANVMISPIENMPAGCIIAYSYSTAGVVHIRIESVKDNITIPANFKFYVTVIQ